MSSVLLLQQQRLQQGLPEQQKVPATAPTCWGFWSADALHTVTQCPMDHVSAAWPAVYAALESKGIASQAVCAAAVATIAIETASTFQPVREAFWLDEDWRRTNLRYYPWYGRGYIQLTWESNYRNYGTLTGVDLLSNADLAMDPDVAAKVFAEFFAQSGAAAAADRHDWAECRRRVQGGSAGLGRLKNIVRDLGLPV
jgi:hypothetical protein